MFGMKLIRQRIERVINPLPRLIDLGLDLTAVRSSPPLLTPPG